MRYLLCLLLLTSCISVKVQKLPAYNIAINMESLDRPKLFYGNTVDKNVMPSMVPYAIINCIAKSTIDTEYMTRRVWTKAAEVKADVVFLSNVMPAYAGTLHTNYGFGIATSQPVYHQQLVGVCFRICPGGLGLSTDMKGMIIVIKENSKLKQIGLLEGDRLLSINNVPLRPIENRDPVFDEYYSELLKLKPGDEVKLVWIRPGVGRMDGTTKMLQNKEMDLNLPDAIPWEPPPKEEEEPDDGRRQL